VQEENIPCGELELYRGMQVEANDGKLGKLDELVLDSKNDEVTHLLMGTRYLWSKKEVAIPVSSIYYSDGKRIYLNIDSTTVKALPAVPVKRLYELISW
jgi:sporulation protein YlmC with PRC-barrel domain